MTEATLGNAPATSRDARATAGNAPAIPGVLLSAEVTAGLVPLLDEIEGAPELFRLGPVALEAPSGPAYAYFFQPDGGGIPLCPGGRWDNPRRRR